MSVCVPILSGRSERWSHLAHHWGFATLSLTSYAPLQSRRLDSGRHPSGSGRTSVMGATWLPWSKTSAPDLVSGWRIAPSTTERKPTTLDPTYQPRRPAMQSPQVSPSKDADGERRFLIAVGTA